MPWHPPDLPPDPTPDDEQELSPPGPPEAPYGPAFLLTSRYLRWGWRT